jgi:hypothetical protein
MKFFRCEFGQCDCGPYFDKPGWLNRSSQRYLEVYLPEFETQCFSQTLILSLRHVVEFCLGVAGPVVFYELAVP